MKLTDDGYEIYLTLYPNTKSLRQHRMSANVWFGKQLSKMSRGETLKAENAHLLVRIFTQAEQTFLGTTTSLTKGNANVEESGAAYRKLVRYLFKHVK